MNYWLVRRKDLTLERPISETEMISKIEEGKIAQEDEICMSCGYWFTLRDTDEVRKHFGNINLHSLFAIAEEERTLETEPVKTKMIRPVLMKPIEIEEKQESTQLLKRVIFTLLVLLAFILMLVSFWLRTY